MSFNSGDVPKDIIAIIDKYLHRDKWENVNDEYIIKCLPFWYERDWSFRRVVYANNRQPTTTDPRDLMRHIYVLRQTGCVI